MNYLTPEQVAEQVGVSRRTVYEWLLSGKLHGLKAGRLWRITQDDLDLFLRSGSDAYTRQSPWGGYSIRKSEQGFIVEGWSQRQGELTDTAHLLPYGTLDMGPETDLGAEYNEFGTYGMALYHALREGAPAKVIRSGREVE